MRVNRAHPNPDAGANLGVRPPGGVLGRVCVMATHMGANRGPVIGGWRAAYMPPLHVSHHPTHAGTRQRAPTRGHAGRRCVPVSVRVTVTGRHQDAGAGHPVWRRGTLPRARGAGWGGSTVRHGLKPSRTGRGVVWCRGGIYAARHAVGARCRVPAPQIMQAVGVCPCVSVSVRVTLHRQQSG